MIEHWERTQVVGRGPEGDEVRETVVHRRGEDALGMAMRRNPEMAGCGKAIVTDAPAPYFADSRVVILCEIMGKSDFDAGSVDEGVRAWYQRDGVHTQYYGKVVRVLVSGQ